MIGSMLGPEYIWIDLFFAAIGEFIVVIALLYSLTYLFSWIYDFNGAMRVYRQMKNKTKGGIK